MSKGKRALLWTGAAIGIITIGMAIFIATLDPNRAKKYLASAVSKTTGRELVIGGDIQLDWGWVSRISATDIRFANAAWSKHPQMAEVGLVDVEWDLWQLLTRFRLVLPRVTISAPKVVLEKNAEGDVNWDFRAAGMVTDPVVPQNRTEFPVIQNLIIKGGALLFDDQVNKTRADLKSVEAEAAGFFDAPVTLKAEGTYQQQPLTIAFDGGSYENLRNANELYPMRIDLSIGKLAAKIDGNLTEPLEMKGENVTLDIQGDDMANLYPVLRLVFPKTPPYRLKGRLKHEGKVWSFSNFSGRVGDSDLAGNIRVDTAPKRPFMKADLVSYLLDFDDLAGFIGGNPSTGAGETASAQQKKEAAVKKTSDRIFPDQHYDLERLNAMDAEVTLRAKKILAPKLPIDNLNAALRLNAGVLQFTPATFGVANGQMEIYSTFDGSKRPSKVKIDARMRQLDLKRFLGQSSFAQKTIGPIGGRIVLTGTGESFREIMATATGDTFLVMAGGEISAKLVEFAGLDVAESIGFAVRGDKSIPVRCALLDLKATDGRAAVQTMVFDTTDTILFGEGSIDLRDEKADLVMLPVPKDFSPVSLRSYIRASGPLNNISVFPDPIKTGTDSVVKKIFNVLTLLVLSPFQPRDWGQGKDIDCDALLAKVQKQDPQGVVLKDVYKNRNPNTVPGDRVQAQHQAAKPDKGS